MSVTLVRGNLRGLRDNFKHKIRTLVDQPGNRIVSKHRAAYDLWLHANIKHATIINTASMDESFKRFAEEGFEVLACLRPKLMDQQNNMPNTRILTGNFSKVSQVWCNFRGNCRYIKFLLLLLEEEPRVSSNLGRS